MSNDDKEPKDIRDVLGDITSRLTGGKVGRADAHAIYQEVLANQKKLRECAGPHIFQDVPPKPPSTLIRRMLCVKCDGVVDKSDAHWYLTGLEHGQQTRNDIIEELAKHFETVPHHVATKKAGLVPFGQLAADTLRGLKKFPKE